VGEVIESHRCNIDDIVIVINKSRARLKHLSIEPGSCQSKGADVAAMGVDAANAIQAGNSLEKMLAHQLAAAHKAAMEMIGSVHPNSHDGSAHTKRLNAAARCMRAYQEGLQTLWKLRQGGKQRIMVQYVNVSEGGQAVIEQIERVAARPDLRTATAKSVRL
jgi:hypothetical protein